MNPQVFREYDIRGVADRDLTDEFARDLGAAFATALWHRGPRGARPLLALGRDCRTTSPRIHAAFCEGVTGAGADVFDLGIAPSPVVYFAPFHWELDGAVVITGSHNPSEDNGFKLLVRGEAIHGAAIRALRERIEKRDLHQPADGGRGRVEPRDALEPYLEHARSTLELGDRRPKVVVDGGNGTGGPAALRLYRELGFEVVDLYCDMDGRFPHHHPDPTVEENLEDLKRRVLEEGAELGIAFDGDADRIGAVDGRGRVLWGDQLMILFGRAILKKKPGAVFIGEVKCSRALYEELERAGGKPIMWKVGHSLIKAKMKEIGAELGGEMSGHIFFKDRYLGFDDAVYAGARLLELLSWRDATLAELYDELPIMVNTPEIRIDCPDDRKFDVVARAARLLAAREEVGEVIEVDGARADFGDGWGLVRASNTQPALVVRCEAVTNERLTEIRRTIESEIERAREET